MSLFSGMKLAGASGSDKRTGKEGSELNRNPTPAKTGKTSETPEVDDTSESFTIADTSDGRQPVCARTTSSSAVESSEDTTDTCTMAILGDQQLCKDNVAHKSSLSKLSSLSVSNSLNVDLDPIKVIAPGDQTQTKKHHPAASLDLQDLDFSGPNQEPAMVDVTSISSFSFITKDPLQSYDGTSGTGSQTLLDAQSYQRQEISESVKTRDDKFEKGGTTCTGTCRGDGEESSSWERQQVCLGEYAERLRTIKKSTCDLAGQVSQLARDCVLSGYGLIERQHELQALQRQQQAAVSEEDYEKAEKLHLQCRVIEDEMGQFGNLLPSNHSILKSVLTELQSLYEQERAERRSMTLKYQELIAEQKEVVDSAQRRRSQWESDHLRKVQEERNELDRDLGHLHLDKEHFHKREMNLADRMAEGTASLRQARDLLIQDRAQVQGEIQNLEAQLAALRLQENVIVESIMKTDREIKAVMGDFDEERSELEREKALLEGEELTLRSRGEGLDKEEQSLAGRIEEVKMVEKSEARRLQDLEEDLAKEEAAIGNLVDEDCWSLAKLWPEGNSVTFPESRENLLKKKDSLRQKMADVQEATSGLLQDHTRVVSLRQTVSDTEGHIAALNETKQLAVSGRNFAEAKRLSDEIKRLTSEGQRIQEEMEGLIKRNEEGSRTVKMLRADVERLREEVDAEDRQTELSTKDKLLDHIAELREQLQSTSPAPLIQMLRKAELASSSLHVKFFCVKHQQPFPAELETFTEDFVADSDRTREGHGLTQEECAVIQDLPRDMSMETLRTELEKLETELQVAVEQEDYDSAELLQRDIDGIQQKIQISESTR